MIVDAQRSTHVGLERLFCHIIMFFLPPNSPTKYLHVNLEKALTLSLQSQRASEYLRPSPNTMCIHNIYYFIGQGCDHLIHHKVTFCPFKNSDLCLCPRSVINRIPGVCANCLSLRQRESLTTSWKSSNHTDIEPDQGRDTTMQEVTQQESVSFKEDISSYEDMSEDVSDKDVSTANYGNNLPSLTKAPSLSRNVQPATLMGPPPKPISRKAATLAELNDTSVKLQLAAKDLPRMNITERENFFAELDLWKTLVRLRLNEADEETY